MNPLAHKYDASDPPIVVQLAAHLQTKSHMSTMKLKLKPSISGIWKDFTKENACAKNVFPPNNPNNNKISG